MKQADGKGKNGFFDRLLAAFRNVLPSPFTLAVILTLVSMLLALAFGQPAAGRTDAYIFQVVDFWQKGFWDLLTFAMQMMLMLVLGHVLALSQPFNRVMDAILGFVKDGATAAGVVTLFTVLAGFFNWGFALILGAILARKVGEYAAQKGIKIHYPLIGAAGYAGLLVWHGGLSGSAPLRVNDPANEFIALMGGKPISPSETLFSTMNLALAVSLIVVLPLGMYLLAKKVKTPHGMQQHHTHRIAQETDPKPESPAEKLDFSRLFSLLLGTIFLFGAVYSAFIKPAKISLDFLNPNYINFLLLGLCLVAHRHFRAFLDAVEQAITGSAGIMIQFPLYAGIMGILSGSGLIHQVSDFFVEISTPSTFPLFTFLSASVVNFFVPSGGGQWAVQGGIVLQAAQELGVSQPKAVMALCYGDQLTNMLQPFWALPLLGITGLKARDILPYTAYLMGIAALLITAALLIF